MQGAAGADGKQGEKAQGLTDAEKLILQKAKAIEAKSRFKAKWPEPPRRKVHHDYLLEEMSWLATDFRQERKWKMAVAKKVMPSLTMTQRIFLLNAISLCWQRCSFCTFADAGLGGRWHTR